MASQVQLAIAVFAPDDIGNWNLDWIGLKAQCSVRSSPTTDLLIPAS